MRVKDIKKIIFPDKCPVCGRIKPQWFTGDESADGGKRVCADCKPLIKYVTEPLCKKCGRKLSDETLEYCADCRDYEHYFTEGRVIFEYDGEMKRIVYRFKYSNRRDLADYFAGSLSAGCERWLSDKKIDVVIPIPLHPDKEKKRGYNQAKVFAEALSKRYGLKMYGDLLLRGRHTSPQKGLSRAERINNLKNAFILGQSGVKLNGLNLLLVDDIYTTGATMDAAASVLKDEGVRDIYFLCICSGVLT